MKITIKEILDKLDNINQGIYTVEKALPSDYFPGHEPLCMVIELLQEYREAILAAKVDI